MLHSKKIKSEYFKKVINGLKPYEIRINDCDYQKGDYLALNEINDAGNYTGRFTFCRITNILSAPEYLKENYVILTIEPKSITPNCAFITYANRWRKKQDTEQRG